MEFVLLYDAVRINVHLATYIKYDTMVTEFLMDHLGRYCPPQAGPIQGPAISFGYPLSILP